TDKSTVELEAPASGTMIEFAIQEGVEGILSGTLLGLLEVDASAAVAESKSKSDEPKTPPQPPVPVTAGPVSSPESRLDDAASQPSSGATVLRGSTPLARRAAMGRDIDLETLAGSGAGGRVLEEDVLRSTPDAASKGSTSALHLRVSCPMDALFKVRASLNRALVAEGHEEKLSIDEFILRAASLALREVPEANLGFDTAAGDASEERDIRIGLAVPTDAGWVTQILRNVDRKGLTVLAGEVRALAKQAKIGELPPKTAGTALFTVVNLGRSGVETIYTKWDSTQSCLLCVGAAEEQPIVRDGEVVVGRVASLTLEIDRGLADGATATRLLAAVRDRLIDPLSMML
ncbi:MAG: 2-oxo acid dehydrogenase subunit E2, partial [Myxococcota bacterium]